MCIMHMCTGMRVGMHGGLQWGMGYTPLVTSRPEGGPGQYRHICASAVDAPPAMPIPSRSRQVTGIYRAVPMREKSNSRTLKSVFKTYIDVIHYRKMDKNRRATRLKKKSVAPNLALGAED